MLLVWRVITYTATVIPQLFHNTGMPKNESSDLNLERKTKFAQKIRKFQCFRVQAPDLKLEIYIHQGFQRESLLNYSSTAPQHTQAPMQRPELREPIQPISQDVTLSTYYFHWIAICHHTQKPSISLGTCHIFTSTFLQFTSQSRILLFKVHLLMHPWKSPKNHVKQTCRIGHANPAEKKTSRWPSLYWNCVPNHKET